MRRVAVAAATIMAMVIATMVGYALGRENASNADQPDDASSPSDTQSTPDPDAVTSSKGPPPPTAMPKPAVDLNPDVLGGPKGSMDDTGSKAVALTFDDGPSPKWTPKVLQLLRDNDVTATFCVIGTEVKANPELVAEIAADGHTLCNHGWHHEFDLGSQSKDDIRDNMTRTNDAILDAAPDASIGYFRQPGGMWTKREIKVAAELGMAPLHWSVDPGDWDKNIKSATIKKQVIDAVKPGGIVLMHDGGGNRKPTYQALGDILADLTGRFDLIGMP